MASNRLDLTLRINAEDQTGPGRAGLQSIEQQLTRLKQTAGAFLTLKVGEIISGQIGNLIQTADAYKTLEGRLKLVSDNTSEYAKAQTALFDIAQRTRGDLGATYNVYGKLESAIKLLGGTQQQALTTTETLNQAIALTSQGATQDADAILQFSQALGSGVLRGDEFNSVMENAPGLAQALADGLDVPITKLRGMAEAGQLTADKLINALGKSADEVAAKFAKIPLTVGGATTQLNNAFTQFVGLADKSTGASATLANGISTLAKNLNIVADAGLIAAEVYGAKLVLGLSRSTQSLVEGAMAARARAAADEQAQQAALALLRVETQTAQIRVITTRGLVEEARLQLVLAGTDRERALATTQVTRAMAAYHAAENTATANQAALTAALGGTTAATTLSAHAFSALNGAMSLAFAFQIGAQVGEWLNQFEKVRQAGSYVAEAFVMVQSGAEAMLNGMSFTERWAQIKQIHAEFDQARASSTGAEVQSAAQISAAEDAKTKAIADAALKQQESFKAVQDAVKALTASIDAETKQQTVLIDQSLTNQLAAIDAMAVSEAQKDTLRVTAKLGAYQQLAQLQQQASDAKLALIDSEYAKELTQAAANAQRTAELETQKRQAKLAVYSGLADYYQGEVAKLSQVYASEFQAAQQAKQQLQQLNQSHEQALFEIKLMGMDERQQLEAKQSEYDKTLLEIKKEQAKGEQADQAKINGLLAEAKTLNTEITRAAGEGSNEIYKAKERENQIWTLQKGILEDNASAHEANANRAKAAQAAVAEKLAATQTAITTITDKLNQDYALKIGVDQASLDSIQSTIAELTKPETKTITIRTVTESAPAPMTESVPSQATGGPAGTPFDSAHGKPFRFAGGGYTPRTGKLPGFGGGDKVKALLEAGEWVIRKEAVKKLGDPVMRLVNAGQLPSDEVIRRASGGAVNYQNLSDGLYNIFYSLGSLSSRAASNEGIYSGAASMRDKAIWPVLYKSLDNLLEKNNAPELKSSAKGLLLRTYQDAIGGDFQAAMARAKENIAAFLTQQQTIYAPAISALSAPALPKAPVLPAITYKASADLQAFASKAAETTAQMPSSNALQPASKTVNVQFTGPNAETVTGQFNENDMNKLFAALKSAGLRTSGGFA